jgi:hypothetical protein
MRDLHLSEIVSIRRHFREQADWTAGQPRLFDACTSPQVAGLPHHWIALSLPHASQLPPRASLLFFHRVSRQSTRLRRRAERHDLCNITTVR